MRKLSLLFAIVCFLWLPHTAIASAECQFVLGFATLRDLIGHDIVGECLEIQHHGANGDALQQTTGGLMAWRKADNWTAFTDGYRTWINGPNGLVQRLNTERFEWEADYAPGGGIATPTPTPTPIATSTPIPAPVATITPTAVPTPLPAPTTTPSPTTVTFKEPGVFIYNDNIFVLPVAEDLAGDSRSFSVPPLPQEEYTQRFYKYFKDEFDFLIIARNLVYGVDTLAPCASYSAESNDVQGIGLPIFSHADRWGSSGRLQGIIRFTHVLVDDGADWTPIGRGPGIHEIMHRWANYTVPTADWAHWGFSSANGLLGGFDITDLENHGDGRYTTVEFNTNGTAGRPFSPIEMYLAGLVPPEEVPDLWVAEDGRWESEEYNPNPTFTASRINIITIEDIIAEHGARVPDVTQSQREFRAAIILLVNEDHPANRRVLELLSEEATWVSVPAFTDEGDRLVSYPTRSTNFYESTGGRATLIMDGLSDMLRESQQ